MLLFASSGEAHEDREAGCVERSPLVLRLSKSTRFPLMLPSNLQSSVLSNDFSELEFWKLFTLPCAPLGERGDSIVYAWWVADIIVFFFGVDNVS